MFTLSALHMQAVRLPVKSPERTRHSRVVPPLRRCPAIVPELLKNTSPIDRLSIEIVGHGDPRQSGQGRRHVHRVDRSR